MSRVLVGGIKAFSDINHSVEGDDFLDEKNQNILRLFNLGGVSDEELTKKISQILQKDLKEPDTLKYVNAIYQNALSLYEEYFFIVLKAPFSQQEFKKPDDIISFLRLTATSKYPGRRQIYCDLIKIMFCFDEIERNRILKEIEDSVKTHVGENYFDASAYGTGYFDLNISSIMGKKKGKDYFETSGTFQKKDGDNGVESIPCILRYRGKRKEHIAIKMLGSERSSSNIFELIRDGIGVELEVDNKDQAIFLLEYIYFVYKDKGDIKQTQFRQKLGFYDKTDIQRFREGGKLSPEFCEFLEKLETVQKPGNSSKYQDVKFQGMLSLGGDFLTGVESRVVIKGNRNQSGISASEIRDGAKIIKAMIGLRGWVSKSYIERIIDKILSKEGVCQNRNNIRQELFKGLVRVPIPKINRNIYSLPSRLQKIKEDASAYPDFIVNALSRSTDIQATVKDTTSALIATLE